MIPKRIFYVWGANEKKRRDVNLCILSWLEKCPEYEIIEINENSVEHFNFKKELENNLWFRIAYENKLYAYIADYIRVKVLYDHGGIYLDTDVSTFKNFDNFLHNKAFVGIQNDTKTNKNILEPAILGSEAGNEILKDILNFYNNDIWKLPLYTMPQIFQYVLEKKYGEITAPEKALQTIIELKDISIYPERYFIPMRVGETFNKDCIEDDTVTIHWFGGSWVKSNIDYFLRNKHKYKLKTLLKKCFSTKTIIANPFLNITKNCSVINCTLDLHFLFRFKYRYYKHRRYLTLFIFGIQIPLWRT